MGITAAILLQWAGDGERNRWEADGKQKLLRIARVDPIARHAALLLGRQHGSGAELIHH
jgi:hypothetical protein